MRLLGRGALIGIAFLVAALVPATAFAANPAAKKPMPTIVLAPATATVVEGYSVTFKPPPVVSDDLGDFNTPTTPPSMPTSPMLTQVAITSNNGVAAINLGTGEITVSTPSIVPLDKGSVILGTYVEAATYYTQAPRTLRDVKHGTFEPVIPHVVTSAPAELRITVTPVAPLPLYLSPILSPGSISSINPDGNVIIGGVLNPDEFKVPGLNTSAYTEEVTVSGINLTCNYNLKPISFSLPEGDSANYSFQATGGSWKLSVNSNVTGTRSDDFVIGGACVTPRNPTGISLIGTPKASNPAPVNSYNGQANSPLPQGNTTDSSVKSQTGFTASVVADKNPAYDAAQAAAQPKGCHANGVDAATKFVDCGIGTLPGHSATKSLYATIPFMIAYFVIFVAVLILGAIAIGGTVKARNKA